MTDIILESISDGVFTVDENWKITSFNRAAEKITGVNRIDAIGHFCFEVFKSNMCEGKCPLRKTMETGKPLIDKSGYIITGNGDKKPISVSTALLADRNGKIIGGAETFRDLSELEELKKKLEIRGEAEQIISNNPEMKKIAELLPVIADSPSTVLIQGATGTGKELLARTIHSLSSRKKGPFIALNCGALPDSLLESELFGYKKGAFTGADKDKPGRFAMAENGTFFLDEIGEISPSLQVKLLRVLQEHEYEPLGTSLIHKTNARIICATNKDLKKMVSSGDFRQDLFFRINIITIELPPLSERKEDIPYFAKMFLVKYTKLMKKNIESISSQVYSFFYTYNWPGNIRELENIIERAVVICSKKQIDLECLPKDMKATLSDSVVADTSGNENDFKTHRIKSEKDLIISTLEKHSYHRTIAAKSLGIDKTTLYRKIKVYNIQLPKYDGRSSHLKE